MAEDMSFLSEAVQDDDAQAVQKRRRRVKPRPSCRAKAVELLARSDQSIRRLTEKLRRKEYSQTEIEETVRWLQDKRFLQEEEGCQRRFEFMYGESCYSLRQIVAKLQQQGYARDLISSFVPEDTAKREYQAALQVIRRKYKPGADRQKIYQHLCMKGFGYDTARNAAEDCIAEWEAEDI